MLQVQTYVVVSTRHKTQDARHKTHTSGGCSELRAYLHSCSVLPFMSASVCARKFDSRIA